MTAVPFVIGQWVRGERFYGRAAEIAEILGAPGCTGWSWIAGLRRIGKTSLLRQVEHLTGWEKTLPLFWDLQGVGDAEELGATFTEGLLDAEEALARRGIPLGEIEDREIFASLEKLARALERRGAALLLLCDEADELIRLGRAFPGLPERLWQAVSRFQEARVVLASSLRLCEEGESLKERFGAPRHLGVMTDEEARALLRQSQLPAAARPPFDDTCVEAIRDRCGNHPMLLQIFAKRCHELGDVEEAFREVAADRAVQHLLAVDFDLLAPAEREVLSSLDAVGESDPGLRRLFDLGLVRREGAGLTIPNRFLDAWLRHRPLPS